MAGVKTVQLRDARSGVVVSVRDGKAVPGFEPVAEKKAPARSSASTKSK